MRKLGLATKSIKDSKPGYGLVFADGKYRAEILFFNREKQYDYYIAEAHCISQKAFYFVDSEGKEIVLKNNWKQKSHASWDCLWGNNYQITIVMTLDSDEISITLGKFKDVHSMFVNLVFDISEQCHTIAEARKYIENLGAYIPSGRESYLYTLNPMQYLEDVDFMTSFDLEGIDFYSSEFAQILKQKASELFEEGEIRRAKEFYKTILVFWPDYYSFCCRRIGWIEEVLGNYRSARGCYQGIIYKGDKNAYAYYREGLLEKRHFDNIEFAERSFKKCIELENGMIEEGICSHLVYAELGMPNKAIEIQNAILAKYPDNPNVYFVAACMYCKLQNYDIALDYLETCLSKGYNLKLAMVDPDIQELRHLERYETIINRF